MRRISGHYTRLDEKQVEFDFEIPSSWEELDGHQYATVLQVLSYHNADRFVIGASLIALLCQKNWDVVSNLPQDELYDLLPLTNFMIEEQPPVKNYFPVLKIRKKQCHAPAADLSNIGFGEWCFVFQFYSYYRKTNDIVWLEKMIATLYRPADPTQVVDSVTFSGDVRERFNENLIEKRALSVRDVPEKFKLAVFGWFTAAINQVMMYRPNVFPPVPEGAELQDQEEQPEDGRTWLSVFRELLGPKWGISDQLKFTNAMFVLDALEEQKIAYDEAMKAAKA